MSRERSYIGQIFALSVSVAIVLTGFSIIFPIFPKLLVIVGEGDAADLGRIAASYGVAFLIFSPIFGNLADRFGKKRIILFGLLGFSLSNLLYVVSTNLTMLYITRIIEGAFSAAISPPAIALTTQLSPPNKRGKFLGYIAASQTVGLIIGPLIGGVLFEGFSIGSFFTLQGSIYLPFYASCAFGLLSLLWTFIMLPKDEFVTRDTSLTVEQSRGVSIGGVFSLLRHQIAVLPKPLIVFGIFIIVEMFTILPWLLIESGFVFYFYDELLLSPTDFGLFVAAFGAVAIIGQTLLGGLSDRYGRKVMMLIGQVFAVIFYFTLPFATTLLQFVLSVVFVGIGAGLRDPALKALLSDVTEEKHRATVFGIESGLISMGQIIGPVFGGAFYVLYGMQFVFNISITICVINFFLIMLISFRKQPGTIVSGSDVMASPIPTIIDDN